MNEFSEKLRELDEDAGDSVDNVDTDETETDELSDTAIWETSKKPTDNVGEASVEINVESLIAELEEEARSGVDNSGRIRRRLEAMMERKRRHSDLADFDDYELD
jgi:hypothetical protein